MPSVLTNLKQKEQTHQRPILVALLLIVLGVLWFVWLYALHPFVSTTPSHHTTDYERQQHLKCHQVQPMVRTILLVFSVFLSCSALFYLSRMICFASQTTTELWLHKGVPMFALLVLFLVQILYILRIRNMQTKVVEHCSRHVKYQYYILYVFAVIQIGVGLYLLFV